MAAATGFVNGWEEAILNYVLRGTAIPNIPAVDANYYLACMTVAPNEDKTGSTEVSTSGTAYARQALKRGTTGTVMGAAAQDGTEEYAESKLTTKISWTQATASWGTVVGVALCEADTEAATDFAAYAPLTESKAIGTNDTFELDVDDFVIKLK